MTNDWIPSVDELRTVSGNAGPGKCWEAIRALVASRVPKVGESVFHGANASWPVTPARESVDVERVKRELWNAWNERDDSGAQAMERVTRRAIELLAPPRDSSPAASGEVDTARDIMDRHVSAAMHEKYAGLEAAAEKKVREIVRAETRIFDMCIGILDQRVSKLEVARDSSAASPAASGAFVEAADAIRNAFRHEKSCGVRGGFKCDCTGMEMLNAYDRARLEMQTPTARDSSAAESGRAQRPLALADIAWKVLAAYQREYAPVEDPTLDRHQRHLAMMLALSELERVCEFKPRAAPPTPAAPEAKADEHGWLAEHGQLYWCGRGNGFGAWTVRVRAVRFARKEDAEAVLADYKCIGRAVRFEDAKVAPAWEAPISTDEGEMSPPGRIFKLGDDTQFIEAVNHADVLAAARRAFEVTDELNRRAPAPEAERDNRVIVELHIPTEPELSLLFSDTQPSPRERAKLRDLFERYAIKNVQNAPATAPRLRDLLRTVEELHGKATKGPWRADNWTEGNTSAVVSGPKGERIATYHALRNEEDANYALCAELRNLVPALLALARGEESEGGK